MTSVEWYSLFQYQISVNIDNRLIYTYTNIIALQLHFNGMLLGIAWSLRLS